MRVLLCDDHAVFREGLKATLAPLGAELLEASDAESALAVLAQDDDLDVVMLDLAMPGIDGWTALRRLREEHPHVPVVIVSASEGAGAVRRALDDGAAGFIPKSSSPAVFRSALQLVLEGSLYLPPALLAQGDGQTDGLAARDSGTAPEKRAENRPVPSLTARQREILVVLSRGLTNAEIASVLGIAEGTVKAHVSAILQVVDVSNRTEAALVMREFGLDEA